MLTAIVILGFVVVAVQLWLLRTSLVEIIKELRMLNIGDRSAGETKVPSEEETQISIDSDVGR